MPKKRIEPRDAMDGKEPINARDPNPIMVVAAERNYGLSGVAVNQDGCSLHFCSGE